MNLPMYVRRETPIDSAKACRKRQDVLCNAEEGNGSTFSEINVCILSEVVLLSDLLEDTSISLEERLSSVYAFAACDAFQRISQVSVLFGDISE